MEPQQQVEIPGVGMVEFPDSMTPDQISVAAKRLRDEANAPKDQGVLRGLMNTVPTPSKLMGMIRSFPDNAKRSRENYALEHPEENKDTPLGKVFNGRPYEGAGELLGTIGQAALGEAAPRLVSARMRPPTPETPPPHLDMSTPIKAGSLTPDQIAERLASAKAQGYQPPPKPQKPMIQTPAAPEAPAAQPPLQVNTNSLPKSWQQFADPPPPPAPTAAPRQGPFAPGIKVLTEKATPTTWTPEAARARLDMNDWSSGAAGGSEEAGQAAGLHRFDAELKSRMQHQLANQNGNVPIGMLLRAVGLPARYAVAGMAAKQVGIPSWMGAGGMAAADVVRANPAVSAEALRAALLAGLASKNGSEP